MRSHILVTCDVDAQDFVTIERLMDEPGSWLPAPAHPVGVRRYRVDLHAGSVEHLVDVAVGPTRIEPGSFTRPLSWVPEGVAAAALLPSFTGDLRLRDDVGGVRLEIEGDYVPPAGILGGVADRVALHRVAEKTLQRLAHDVAERLGHRVSSAT